MIKYVCDVCGEEKAERHIAYVTGTSKNGEHKAEICTDCFGKTFAKIEQARSAATIKENTGQVDIYSKAVQAEQAKKE